MKSRYRINTLEEFVESIMVEAQILALRSRDKRLQDIVAECATAESIQALTDLMRSRAMNAGIENAFTNAADKVRSRLSDENKDS
tara:strand:+ start:131 stop:385 length:255 start_codon:yes stop_codon:yes gene_type:complete